MEIILVGAVTVLSLIVSTVVDAAKTGRALKIAGKRFLTLLPPFMVMLAAVSLALAVVPHEMLVRYLGRSNTAGATLIAAGVGSISLMPGFVAFPLAGILVHNGVSKMAIAAFTTTLMMVGVLTFPVERKYLGTKVTVLRNLVSLAVTVAITVAIGFYFGEIGL